MQSQVKLNRVPEKVPEKVWEASVQPFRFNNVPKKVPGEGLGGFGAEPGQVQQGSGEGSRKRGCKAKSGLVRRRPRSLWCRATVSEKVPEV